MPLLRTTVRRLGPLAVLGALAMPASAQARPVAATDFQITYRFTDDEGNTTQLLLGANDLTNYVNRARCQCGEKLTARVFLQRSTDDPYDNLPIRTYVGSNCDLGQDGLGGMNQPCVQMYEGQPTDYDDGGIDIVFDTVWLSSRVPGLGQQSPDTPPVNPCADNQSGTGGVWICAENGMQTDCQSSEFIITGTQSTNGSGTTGGTTPTDPTGGMGSTGGLNFDYQPPMGTVTGFTASPGDGAVQIRWDRTESTQIAGYRILCADLDGNPPPGKGASQPAFSQRTNGRLYYTADNLCEGEVVYGDDASSGGTDGGTGTTGGDESTTGDIGDPARTTGVSDSGTTTGGSDTGSDTPTIDLGGSPLASLDWRYVCSDHISGTGTEERVEGLQNGVTYQFIVVAYDSAGNPLIVSGNEVLTETPEETTDFWEQCEMQGDLCGNGGFCQCRAGEGTGAAWLGTGLMLLVLAGLRRRSRA